MSVGTVDPVDKKLQKKIGIQRQGNATWGCGNLTFVMSGFKGWTKNLVIAFTKRVAFQIDVRNRLCFLVAKELCG